MWKFEVANWNALDGREKALTVRDAHLVAMDKTMDVESNTTFDSVGDAIDSLLEALGTTRDQGVYVVVQCDESPGGALSLNIGLSIESVRAMATLTFTGTALTDGDTVTIGTRTYTFKTLLTGNSDELLIGAVTDSLANLKSAVNGSAGEGTSYGAGTVPHESAEATILTSTTALTFRARAAGVTGNTIGKSEASSNLSWDSGATFSGGI